MRWLTSALLVIVGLSIVLVATLSRPDMIGELEFWAVIFWFLFLAFLNWAASTYTFSKAVDSDKSTQFGVLPSLNILVFSYSVLSVVLLVFSWNTSNFGVFPNWHLIAQIIISAVTAVVGILMLMAAKAAKIEMPDGVKPKEEILQRVAIHISTLESDKSELKSELVKIRDYIQFSMAHTARIKNLENYKKLYAEIHNLDLSKGDVSENARDIIRLLNVAKSC